jgi:hypothetical protein
MEGRSPRLWVSRVSHFGLIFAVLSGVFIGASTSANAQANSCDWAYDGECDDPTVPGHVSRACSPGTDTADCSQLGAAPQISGGIFIAPNTADCRPDPGTLQNERVGGVLCFEVTGITGAYGVGVWGGSNGVYSQNSSLAMAAVHAGVLRAGQYGRVQVQILPG